MTREVIFPKMAPILDPVNFFFSFDPYKSLCKLFHVSHLHILSVASRRHEIKSVFDQILFVYLYYSESGSRELGTLDSFFAFIT